MTYDSEFKALTHCVNVIDLMSLHESFSPGFLLSLIELCSTYKNLNVTNVTALFEQNSRAKQFEWSSKTPKAMRKLSLTSKFPLMNLGCF